jgi:hypothetical protein
MVYEECLMHFWKQVLRQFLVPLIVSLLAICFLTEAASRAVSSWRGQVPQTIAVWASQGPANRFDDHSDAFVAVNLLCKAINPNFSLWTYYQPLSCATAGWQCLQFSLNSDNRSTLFREIAEKHGQFVHRYWTGHLVLTAIVFYVYPSLSATSQIIFCGLVISLFIYLQVWRTKLGTAGSIFVAMVLLGSGIMWLESFHSHTWGMTFAFATASWLGRALAQGKSYIVPAVVGSVFANWVGYDYVFDTLAFSLPFFLVRIENRLELQNVSTPAKFVLVFLLTTAIMMLLRLPVAYLDGHDVVDFLLQIKRQVAYHLLGGEHPPGENIPQLEVSRFAAVAGVLPMLNDYLFRLGGVLSPKIFDVKTYILIQILPLPALFGILVWGKKENYASAIKPTALLIFVLLLFHPMFVVFTNHACIHPWMDVRHCVFSLAICWGVLVSALWQRCSSLRPKMASA